MRRAAAQQILDRGGPDNGARPQSVNRDPCSANSADMPSTHMLMPNLLIV